MSFLISLDGVWTFCIPFKSVTDPGFPQRGKRGCQPLCLGWKPIITVRNEVAKVMFLQVSVCPRGGVSAPGGAWSRGVYLVPGGAGIPACTEADPPRERWLLLRTVRILLECILIWQDFCRKLYENERNWTERGHASLAAPASNNEYIISPQNFILFWVAYHCFFS